MTTPPQSPAPDARLEVEGAESVPTGIEGLDAIVGGGLPAGQAYLLHGPHGAGKTTMGLQFCLEGRRRDETALFISTNESPRDLEVIARSHGWALEGVHLHYHDAREDVGAGPDQSVFHAAEVELPRTMDTIRRLIREVDPHRLVIDSLSEIRLLADAPRWYRRQILAVKDELAERRCTTLLCDAPPTPTEPVQSIVHGVMALEQEPRSYGDDRRRLRVTKLRGRAFAGGWHDYRIRQGGLEVYPRLVTGPQEGGSSDGVLPSGLAALDALCGGGIDRGTATLLIGPTGTGKSALATQFSVAAARRGEHVSFYAFDERLQSLYARSRSLRLDLDAPDVRDRIEIRQVDPAELSPGEFGALVRKAVLERDRSIVVIDSLTGYFHAMPDEHQLALHLHELLSFLAQQGVSAFLVMTQHGSPGGHITVPFDVSYVADNVLLSHRFEFGGAFRRALSVYKRRQGDHEPTLRELDLGPDGIRIGEPLTGFRGIFSGTPTFVGEAIPDAHRPA